MSRVGARVVGVALQDVHLKPCKGGKVPLAVRKHARRQPQGTRWRPGSYSFCSEMQRSRSGEAAEIYLRGCRVVPLIWQSLSCGLSFQSMAPAPLMQRPSLGT